MTSQTRMQMLILAAVPLIMVLGNTMLFPVFPEMRQALGISQAQLGWLTLAISLPSSLIAPFTGRFADKIGRKAILLPSLWLYAIGGALAGIASLGWKNAFFWILVGRVIQGIGSGGPMHLSTVLAGDIFQSEERATALGLIETANGSGKVLSPIIGSLVGMLAWWGVFWVYPIVAIPLSIILWKMVKEPRAKETKHKKTPFRWCLLWEKINILGLLSGFLALFSLLGVMFWLSDHLEAHWHLARIYRGLLLAVPVAVAAGVAALAGFFQKFGARVMLGTGLLICGIAVGLIPPFSATAFLWPILVILGSGIGLILPALDLFSTSLVAKNERATLTSLYSALRSVGAAIAPFTVALVLPWGLYATFWPLTVMLVMVGLLMLLIVKEQELPDNLTKKREASNS